MFYLISTSFSTWVRWKMRPIEYLHHHHSSPSHPLPPMRTLSASTSHYSLQSSILRSFWVSVVHIRNVKRKTFYTVKEIIRKVKKQSMLSCFSHVRLFATPWAVASQAPLSMGFPRQEYWCGLHFLLQGTFLTQELNLSLLHCQADSYDWATRETCTHKWVPDKSVCYGDWSRKVEEPWSFRLPLPSSFLKCIETVPTYEAVCPWGLGPQCEDFYILHQPKLKKITR